MPKLKTKKSLSKRVKVNKNKVTRSKAGRKHLLSSKTTKRKRGLRKKANVSYAERTLLKLGLPYSG